MDGRADPIERSGLVAVGDLRTVARQADPAPGVLGGHYRRFGAATVDESGAVSFVADLAGSMSTSAILRCAAGITSVLVAVGEPAPGGGRFAAFGDLDAGEDGRLAFRAKLAGGETPDGIFQWSTSGVTPVVRAGEPTPGDRRHRSFGQLALSSFELDTGAYSRLAYTTSTSGGGRSLVIWPCYRDPSEILATGEQVAGGTLMDFVISRLGLGLCVVAQVQRGATVRQVPLLVNEDQVIWGGHPEQGTHLPELGRIGRLLTPPAVYVHHGLIALALQSGDAALVIWPGAAGPEVFARTGDPAPGIPGDRIDRFGPPVVSSGMPGGGSCGIATAVRLRSGTQALWTGVFPSPLPMAGAAVIPLVAGDYTDDQPPMLVDRFRPVKLTNTGALLLRATLVADGRRTSGLLLLDRLMDWYDRPQVSA